MVPFIIDGESYRIDRLEQECKPLDVIAWLQAERLYPKVFWKERNSSMKRAAVGKLLSFAQVPHFSESCPFDLRFYGGMCFHEEGCRDETWGEFPKGCFWLPEIEIFQDERCARIIHYAVNRPAEKRELVLESRRSFAFNLKERREEPNRKKWEQNVDSVLSAISAGHIDKLVLARKTTLQFAEPLSPWPLLAHLEAKAKQATVFAFQLSEHRCFLGATPEKLFERRANQCHADAVAATRPRGKTHEEEHAFERELLTSAKEQREFRVVKEYLDAALSPLSEKMQWQGNDVILKGSHVQHLHNRLSVNLLENISDRTLIQALHPTPAVGGFLRQPALQLLKEIEAFDRGWYGAPIGIIEPNGATLYVAIRSALVQDCLLHLFAGTGIVQGSLAEKEWEELEQKMRPFMELFDG